MVPFPNSDVKITRNISGNANVKKAEAGLRQKALFVKRTCRTASSAHGAHQPHFRALARPPVSSR